ncbi:MAG: hypothetical protein ACK5P5_03195 [Pseudobdellovibrionaceae bacterium]
MKLLTTWIILFTLIIQGMGLRATYAQVSDAQPQVSNAQPQSVQKITEPSQTVLFPSVHPTDPNSAVQITQTALQTTVGELEATLDQNLPHRDLLVSTDSEVIADQVAATQAKRPSRVTRLIPIGQLTDHLNQRLRNTQNAIQGAYQHLQQAARNDKIGLIIVTINTVYDSFVWMHATQYSTEVAVAQSLFSVIIAMAFSVDKDLWSRMAWKVQNRMIRLFDSGAGAVGADTPAMSRTMEMATAFAAHMTLSTGIQAIRLGICSYDQAMTLPYVVSSVAIALAVAALNTFSSFAFADFLARIDQDRYPFAKSVFRRFQEVRSIILGNLAASGKVLQPSVFGFTAHITLLVTGILGIVFYANRSQIVDWVEKIPQILNFKNRLMNVGQGFSDLLNKTQRLVSLNGRLQCTSVL